jgi:hypothetical protein
MMKRLKAKSACNSPEERIGRQHHDSARPQCDRVHGERCITQQRGLAEPAARRQPGERHCTTFGVHRRQLDQPVEHAAPAVRDLALV